MLPAQHKLTSSEAFKKTIRKGKRAGRSTVVVHLLIPEETPFLEYGGPRCGLIVSKAVGNAVVRHHVSRILREAFREVVPQLPTEATVVLRALAAAKDASSSEIIADVESAVTKLLAKRDADA